MMTLRRWLFALLALAVTSAASARLGETLPELVARFGETVGRQQITMYVDGRQREVGHLFRFRVDDWAIDAIMVDGICAQIRYGKSDAWTDEQVGAVLEANAHERAWTEQPPREDGRAWRRDDDATAVWQKDRAIILELPIYRERTQSATDTHGSGSRRR